MEVVGLSKSGWAFWLQTGFRYFGGDGPIPMISKLSNTSGHSDAIVTWGGSFKEIQIIRIAN